MPPVFGIARTKPVGPPQAVTGRMAGSATYARPRRLATLKTNTAWMAAALRSDCPAAEDGTVLLSRGDLIIAADASLYNRQEILHRLGNNLAGAETGDAGIILLAWEKWGSRCPEYLYGDFAFIILNTATGEIFCARDPMGVRPLFYTLQGEDFIFASELRMVLAALDPKPEVSEEYLLDSLVTIKSPRETSPFGGIYRLPPAHYLVCKNGTMSITRYWMPDTGERIRLAGSEEYIGMFRELLRNAVNMRCQGVISPGSELSGGLDSSAVTGIAADAAESGKQALTAFSNLFPDGTDMEFKDEREFIGSMLEFKPVKWQGIDRLGIPLTDLFRYTLDIQGVFIQQNFSVFNYGLYRAAGEAGIRVLLSGFGGDELVSARTAMPWNEMIRDRQWRVIRDEIYYRGLTLKSLGKPGLLAARYLVSLFHKPAYRSGVFTPELLGKRLANLPLQKDFMERHHLEQRYSDKYRIPNAETLAARQLSRISMEHLPQRMEYCYAAAAQEGLEYRYPLLDVNLVLATLAFPPQVKQHHGTNRYLFRQAIRGFVPESIRQRDDKSGSTIPHVHHTLASEKEQILELVRQGSGSQRLQEIFDFTRFESWYEKLVKRDPQDMNYMMPGAFYDYLMIMMYVGSNK